MHVFAMLLLGLTYISLRYFGIGVYFTCSSNRKNVFHKFGNLNNLSLKGRFYKQAYHVELNAYSDGHKAMANIQENGRIILACYLNTVGEPRSEIPSAPHLFKSQICHTPSAATQRGGRVGLSLSST